MKLVPVLVSLMIISSISGPARADGDAEFATYDFSLRLPAALAKFSSYGDVAGQGGASAGSRYATGFNPASSNWQPLPGHPFALSPQLSRIRFERAPTLQIASLSGGFNTTSWGTFQPSVARISNNGRQQDDFLLLEGEFAQLQWGKKITDSLAIGANVNYSKFNTKAGFGGMLVVDGDSATRGLRTGLLWSASKQLLVGLVLDQTRAHNDTLAFVPDCTCMVPFADKSSSRSARIGVSYEYAALSSVYADYMNARFRGPTGAMGSKAIMAGLEHQLRPGVFGRAGVTRDLRGFSSVTMGIGITPSKTWSIDLAFQRDMFPELRQEFGRSKLLNLSVNVSL
jgi:hypothetical protein